MAGHRLLAAVRATKARRPDRADPTPGKAGGDRTLPEGAEGEGAEAEAEGTRFPVGAVASNQGAHPPWSILSRVAEPQSDR